MKNFKPIIITSLVWCLCLSSCAGLKVKTWFTDSTQVKKECQDEKPFIRRDSHGNIKEALSVLEADGYRAYSASDDEAWRNRLTLAEQCCASKQ